MFEVLLLSFPIPLLGGSVFDASKFQAFYSLFVRTALAICLKISTNLLHKSTVGNMDQFLPNVKWYSEYQLTLLNNLEGTKKNCLGLWLVLSESSHFLVSEMLFFKILLFWLFEKNNFDYFLFSGFQLQNPIEMKLGWNFQ